MKFAACCILTGLWAAAGLLSAPKSSQSNTQKKRVLAVKQDLARHVPNFTEDSGGFVARHHTQISPVIKNKPEVSASFNVKGGACAVCFVGLLRGLSQTAQGIRTKFLEPIAAHGVSVDVFVAAERGGPDNIAGFGFPYPNSPFHIELRNHIVRDHQDASEIERMVLLTAPQSAVAHYRATPGNWISPLFGNRGNCLRYMRLENDCTNMVREAEAQDSKKYTWFVRTRPDFIWMAPHPPLSMTSLDKVWAFEGQGHGGVNARHAVGPSDLMLTLWSRYDMVMKGDPVVYQVTHESNDEMFVSVLFNHLNIHLGQLDTPAYLVPKPSWNNTGWREAGEIYTTEQERAIATAQKGFCWYKASDIALEARQCTV